MEKARKIRCDCGKFFAEKMVKVGSITTKALVCPGCGHITFTKEQAMEYGRLKEIREMIGGERKIIKIGNSIGITLPEKLGLKPGRKVRTEVIDSKSFKVIFG
ncbi:hypothetical protein COV19_00345 [Candidatus Woesearchaeota archaeon CG10_big_fil_rev_8_21_14_0_10_44_13]|nr:MAG: hypothetical protein COV19_00345 [Candidatus Woesearchaeota archaeon CG10_big_fil_rev_8_21_14_0_10_44_13]